MIYEDGENIVIEMPHAETFKRKVQEVTVDKKLIEEVLGFMNHPSLKFCDCKECETESGGMAENYLNIKSRLEELLKWSNNVQ